MTTPSAPQPPALRAELPASLLAPRQARTAIRRALSAWHLTGLAADAELLVSELVANAAEHARTPISLTIRHLTTPAGQHGIACEITDTSPAIPAVRPTEPDWERGRGLAIVTALATSSGITTTRHGKTAWFTLTRSAEPEPELEPGA